MKSSFEIELERKIRHLTENRFQEFVEKLFKKHYGEDFEELKDKKDGGADGIINGNQIVAVYGPEKHKMRKFRNKVDNDYEKFEENWKGYSEWMFVYNEEFTKKRIDYLEEKHSGCGRKDLRDLVNLVLELSYPKQGKIAEYLGINQETFEFDLFKKVIDDVIGSDVEVGDEPSDRDIVYIKEKAEENFEETEPILKEFEQILPDLGELKEVLSSTYDDREIRILKNKVITRCDEYEGDFKNKFENTIDYFASKRPKDDVYRHYIRVIVYYCFERCLIGKKGDVVDKAAN